MNLLQTEPTLADLNRGSAYDRSLLRRASDVFRRNGFFSADGAAEPLIPRLIEAGVGVLNPIQHVCPGMNCKEIKAKYGDKLIFHGGVENQSILPFGTPDEVAADTRKCLEDLGPEGYLPCSCHFAQADTPIKNIVALIETVQQYRL